VCDALERLRRDSIAQHPIDQTSRTPGTETRLIELVRIKSTLSCCDLSRNPTIKNLMTDEVKENK
jgi:hypothetical protein